MKDLTTEMEIKKNVEQQQKFEQWKKQQAESFEKIENSKSETNIEIARKIFIEIGSPTDRLELRDAIEEYELSHNELSPEITLAIRRIARKQR